MKQLRKLGGNGIRWVCLWLFCITVNSCSVNKHLIAISEKETKVIINVPESKCLSLDTLSSLPKLPLTKKEQMTIEEMQGKLIPLIKPTKGEQ